MNNGRWYFPDNGYGIDSGLNTADFETFKRDRIVGLARETVQNSIDAKIEGADFVRVEFREFEIDRNQIPDIDVIERQLKSAYELRMQTGDEDAADKIENELTNVRKSKFKCLRISDFNTIGLRGILTDDLSSPFHYLVKGSGLSNKNTNSGGSKGVGKNAAFVNSNFETIFYSTYTDENEKGHIGVAKLSSAPIEGTSKLSMGTGFYGCTEKIVGIDGLFDLDPNYRRREFGTDIYIIDFNDEGGWEHEIIPKILESFMYALLQGKLVVNVGPYELNKDSIGNYVLGDKFLGTSRRDRDIISQYLLLTSGIEPYEIKVENLGTAKLYFMDCTDEKYRDFGNKKCAMIRYPYMKICDEKFTDFQPFTALCIIENDELCRLLREIENPQHENFEFGRLPKDKLPYYRNFYNKILLGQIESYIRSKLSSDGEDETEFIGSEEYLSEDLPDAPAPKEDGDIHKVNAIVHFSKKKRKVKAVQQNRLAVPDAEGESVIMDILGENSSDEEILVPSGNNNSDGGPYHSGDNYEIGKEEGDSKEGIRLAALRGIKYRFACLNKQKGIYMIRFKSDFTREDVKVEIRSIDESYRKENVPIVSAEVNGVPVNVDRNRSFKISLIENEEFVIKLVLDQKDYFSAEVVCYESR